MLAAVSRRYGPPDVVTIADVPAPEPRDDEILGRRVRRRHTWTDFTRAGRRYDVAGTSSFGRCRRVLSPGGVYLTTAPSPAIFAAMPWTARFGTRRAVVAFTGLRPASEKLRDLMAIRELAEASALVPVVGACYPLARIADAHRHVDAGHKKGTIVVTVS